MSYNCVVCVKQVPDTHNITGDAMKADGTVNRQALPAVFNPDDLHALEAALAIRDEHGGSVTAITMGLPSACDVLRECLFRGADRVILLTDRRAAGSDTLATSHILSRAIERLDADIVLCGLQAIDGDTAQVGPQIAEKIDFTPITCVDRPVVLEDRTVTARRNVGNGWELVSAELPVLLTIMGKANTPRPPALRRAMKLKKARCHIEVERDVLHEWKEAGRDASDKETLAAAVNERCGQLESRGLMIETWNLDDVQADLAWCGLHGSPTKVRRVQAIVLSGGDYKQFENTDHGIASLIAELVKDHTIG